MSNIYMIGDLHQDFKPVRGMARQLGLEGGSANFNRENILICLGDFGANFSFDYRDRNFKKKLGKYDFTYFVIRGNHEERPSICMEKNPDDWEIETFFDAPVFVEKEYPYIKYAIDCPCIYHIRGLRALVLPGAYSVDKYYRLEEALTWFPQEQLTEEEKEYGRLLIKMNPNFDLVLSHTCPKIFEPTDLFLSCIDQTMVDDSMEKYLSEIEFNINYALWAFGHFHATRVYPKVEDYGQMLMLFNSKYLDLTKYLDTMDIDNSLYKIES